MSYEPSDALTQKLAELKKSSDIHANPPPITFQTSEPGADNDMYVHLSPLDSAKDLTRNKRDVRERHPMAFSPPSFDLGFDSTPAEEEPIDAIPISFAHHQTEEVLMAQPYVEGRKAMKFVEPLVQGNLPSFLCGNSFIIGLALFVALTRQFQCFQKGIS